MAVPELARVAGEAFRLITGVDLAYQDLEGEWPDGFEAGPSENPEDEDVALDADEDLPWPDPVLVQQWWDANKARYRNGQRYLMGEQISVEQCSSVLRNAFQRQPQCGRTRTRTHAAGDPAIRDPGPWFTSAATAGGQLVDVGPLYRNCTGPAVGDCPGAVYA